LWGDGKSVKKRKSVPRPSTGSAYDSPNGAKRKRKEAAPAKYPTGGFDENHAKVMVQHEGNDQQAQQQQQQAHEHEIQHHQPEGDLQHDNQLPQPEPQPGHESQLEHDQFEHAHELAHPLPHVLEDGNMTSSDGGVGDPGHQQPPQSLNDVEMFSLASQ